MIKELLLLAVPLSVALFYLFRAPPLWIFGVSILAVDPPGRGNKESPHSSLAKLAGPAVGGLLNVTFGNAPSSYWPSSSWLPEAPW